MLLIRRRAGQSLWIGADVEIHIAELSPSRVTIGISAPREVSVTRSELALTEQQNVAAADSVSPEALARLARGFQHVR
jgi:carbon storage regulator